MCKMKLSNFFKTKSPLICVFPSRFFRPGEWEGYPALLLPPYGYYILKYYNTYYQSLAILHDIFHVMIRNVKGVLHPWALFLKTLCIFSKNKATLDKVSYGSGQKCSKKLKNHSFTSVGTIVVKLQ